VVAVGDEVDDASSAGAGDGEPPRDPGASAPRNPGPSAPPPHQQVAPTSTHSWPKRASSRRSSRRSIAWYASCVPPSLGKPPLTASACASWASRLASASTSTSMLMTRTRRRARARSSLQPQRCYGPCSRYHRLKHGTCTVRRRRSSSKWSFNRPRARRPACASQAVCGTTVTTPPEIIPYYHLNHSVWSLSDNKEVSR
jgi:hypothetical protein